MTNRQEEIESAARALKQYSGSLSSPQFEKLMADLEAALALPPDPAPKMPEPIGLLWENGSLTVFRELGDRTPMPPLTWMSKASADEHYPLVPRLYAAPVAAQGEAVAWDCLDAGIWKLRRHQPSPLHNYEQVRALYAAALPSEQEQSAPTDEDQGEVCCGNFVVGAEYMGQREMICCGNPNSAPNDEAREALAELVGNVRLQEVVRFGGKTDEEHVELQRVLTNARRVLERQS